jgi:hypothetical protein
VGMASHIAPVPDLDEVPGLFEALGSQLWRQRELLEDLLYALVTQRLVLESDLSEWLIRADEDVRAAASRLQDAEVVRAVTTEQLNRRYGLDPAASLRGLVAVAPEPWATMLTDHRQALLDLTEKIDAVAADVETSARARLRARRTGDAE